MIIDYKELLYRLIDKYIETRELAERNKKIVEKLNEWKVNELIKETKQTQIYKSN